MNSALRIIVSALVGLVVVLFFEWWGASIHVALIPGAIATGATMAFLPRE